MSRAELVQAAVDAALAFAHPPVSDELLAIRQSLAAVAEKTGTDRLPLEYQALNNADTCLAFAQAGVVVSRVDGRWQVNP